MKTRKYYYDLVFQEVETKLPKKKKKKSKKKKKK